MTPFSYSAGSKAARRSEAIAAKRAARAEARGAGGMEGLLALFEVLRDTDLPESVERVPLPRLRHGEARAVAALAAQYGLRLGGKGRQAWVARASGGADALALRRLEMRAEHGRSMLRQQGQLRGPGAEEGPRPGQAAAERDALVELRRRTGKALRKNGRAGREAVAALVLATEPREGGVARAGLGRPRRRGPLVEHTPVRFVSGGVMADAEEVSVVGGGVPVPASGPEAAATAVSATSVSSTCLLEVVEDVRRPENPDAAATSTLPLDVFEDRAGPADEAVPEVLYCRCVACLAVCGARGC